MEHNGAYICAWTAWSMPSEWEHTRASSEISTGKHYLERETLYICTGCALNLNAISDRQFLRKTAQFRPFCLSLGTCLRLSPAEPPAASRLRSSGNVSKAGMVSCKPCCRRHSGGSAAPAAAPQGPPHSLTPINRPEIVGSLLGLEMKPKKQAVLHVRKLHCRAAPTSK